MRPVRLRIVTSKIARVGEDPSTCGEKCQFLHGSECWLDGVEDLEKDALGNWTRILQCVDAEEKDQ